MNWFVDLLGGSSVTVGMVFGAALPLLTAVIQQPRWTARRRVMVAQVIALVVGIATVGTTTGFGDWGEAATTVVAVVAASEAAYQRLWKPSGAAAAVESRTVVDRSTGSE